MDKLVEENHNKYLARKTLYKSFNYDVDQERYFVLEQAKPFSGRILEAGTGKGHFALCLAREGYHFVTFDISPDEQNFAKLNLAYSGLERMADFRIENAERTGFSGESFDVIFSVNVLHHLSSPYLVIDEFIRILSPGGKLVLADFTAAGFQVMERIHSLEGHTHETGKAGLADVEAYLKKKGFLIKKASSAYQCVLVARKGGI